MLIKFTVENWMSFRGQSTFSMIATREKQHRSRIPLLKKYKTKILPIAAIYLFPLKHTFVDFRGNIMPCKFPLKRAFVYFREMISNFNTYLI